MRADFQQYYGLDVDELGGAITYERAAALASQLPRDSRVFMRIDDSYRWTDAQYLLSSIEYSLRVLVWSKTKDAQRGANKPKPPYSPIRKKIHAYTRSDMESVADAFGIDAP